MQFNTESHGVNAHGVTQSFESLRATLCGLTPCYSVVNAFNSLLLILNS